MSRNYKDYFIFLFFITVLNFLGPLAMFLPAPFFILGRKFSFSSLLIMSFFPLLLFFPLLANDKLSLYLTLLHYGCMVIPSLLIIYLKTKFGFSAFAKLFFSALGILLFVFAVSYVFNHYFDGGIFNELSQRFFEASNLSKQDLEYLKTIFEYGGIAMIFFSESIFFLFNAVYFSKNGGVLDDFLFFKAPWHIVVFAVIFVLLVNFLWFFNLLTGKTLFVVAVVSAFLFFIFFAQGLAIYLFFLKRLGIGSFAKVIFIMLIFIYPMPFLLTLIGITDFWIDFRNRIIRLGGGKVV